MDDQDSNNEHLIPRLIEQFLKELEIGLKPFDDTEKIDILNHIIPFAQAVADGEEDLRPVYENSFHWIVQTYRKKAKLFYDCYLQDYFFNGSIKFFPELKKSDSEQESIGILLGEQAFDEYLFRLLIALKSIRERLYLLTDPFEEKTEDSQDARGKKDLSLKQTGLFYHYLNLGHHICEDKKQLAYIASKASGYGEENLYKKIISPLGRDLDAEQSRNHLIKDLETVKELLEHTGKDAALKYVVMDLADIYKSYPPK